MKVNTRKLKNRLRQHFPDKVIVNKFKEKLSTKKTKIIFMDVPTNGNLGDQALVYAGKKYLINLFPDLEIVEVANDEINSSLRQLRKSEDNFTSVVWNGGGNIGTLYPTAELSRWDAFRKLKEKEFIIFPQSVYFSNDIFGKKFLEKSKHFYSVPSNISVFLREKKSFNFVKENYNIKNVNLVPDIVFSLENNLNLNFEKQRKGVLTLLRSDKEKGTEDTDFYVELLREKGYLIEESDTFINKIKVSPESRDNLLENFWRKMAIKELIITDRLHGMIFAYLTKTPAIVFQNNNWKIKSTYDTWLKNCDFIEMADVRDDHFIKQVENLRNIEASHINMADKFESLSNVLRSTLKNGKK